MTRDIERDERAGRLRWAREQAGYSSPRDAAKRCGWNPSTYRAHEAGTNGFDNDAGRKYAAKFHVNLAWLMTGEGIMAANRATSPVPSDTGGTSMVATIPVVGVVKMGGLVDFSLSGEMQHVRAPEAGNWRALRIEGTAIQPRYEDGQILYYPSERFAPSDVVGQECVVEVAGRVYVRMLMAASTPNRWHLGAPNAEPMLNTPVEWASPIIWVRRGALPFQNETF